VKKQPKSFIEIAQEIRGKKRPKSVLQQMYRKA
jgi:hypothetical protein